MRVPDDDRAAAAYPPRRPRWGSTQRCLAHHAAQRVTSGGVPPGYRADRGGHRTDRRAGRGTAVAPVVQRTKPARSTVARQVAALGLVLCAVALTLAYPLRNYLAQREALAHGDG